MTDVVSVPSEARLNAFLEGFTVAAIYYAVATPLFFLRYAYVRSSLEGSRPRLTTMAGVIIGSALAQLLLLGFSFSAIVWLRSRWRVGKGIFKDLRFWLVVTVAGALRINAALALFWCCLIYAYREHRRGLAYLHSQQAAGASAAMTEP